jgi:hypothetical protein
MVNQEIEAALKARHNQRSARYPPAVGNMLIAEELA